MKTIILLLLATVALSSVSTPKTVEMKLKHKESLEIRNQRFFFYRRFAKFRTLSAFLKANKDKKRFFAKHMDLIKNLWTQYQSRNRRYMVMAAGQATNELTSNGGYFTGDVSIGTPAQNFTLDFDTGSSDLWVADSSCGSNCGQTQTFNPSASSTYESTGQSFNIQYGSGSASGTTGTDVVTVAGLTATGFIVNPVTSDSGFPSNPFGGIFGMGWSSISAHTNNPSPTLVQTLQSQGQIDNAVFSLYLGTSNENPALVIGGTNSAYYTGSITYYSLYSASYWEINWDGVSIDGTLYAATESQTIVDSGTTLLLFSTSLLSSIQSALGVSTSTFSCQAALSNIAISINSDLYTLTPSQYLAETSTGICELGIETGAEQIGMDILGDIFFSGYYVVFDYDNTQIGFATNIASN